MVVTNSLLLAAVMFSRKDKKVIVNVAVRIWLECLTKLAWGRAWYVCIIMTEGHYVNYCSRNVLAHN